MGVERFMADGVESVKSMLAKRAAEVARAAYSPYSGYAVGAAAISDDGRVFIGCNVENASFGLTVCAERAAVCAAVSAGVRRIAALAIAAGGNDDAPATPCGACRQTLAEFCADDAPVFCAGLDGAVRLETSVGALLPHSFKLARRGAESGGRA